MTGGVRAGQKGEASKRGPGRMSLMGETGGQLCPYDGSV